MQATIFPAGTMNNRVAYEIDEPFVQLAARLQAYIDAPPQFKQGDKEAQGLAAWYPGTFRFGPAPQRKRAGGAQYLTGCALDLDDIPAQAMLDLIDSATAQGLEYYVHTTWKHGTTDAKPDTYRARLVMPFDAPLPANEWPQFKGPLKRLFPAHIPVDTKVMSDRSRLFYVPVTRLDAPPPISEYHAGMPLNTSLILANSTVPQASAALVARGFTEAGLDTTIVDRARIRMLANKWKRIKSETRDEPYVGALLCSILDGKPYAEHPNRDNTTFLVLRLLLRAFPSLSPDYVASLFAPSLQLMGWEGPTEGVAGVVARLQRDMDQPKPPDAKRQARIEDAFAPSPLAPTDGGPETAAPRAAGYSGDEIAQIAEDQLCTVEQLQRRWIVQRGQAWWLLDSTNYRGPYTSSDVYTAMLRDLAPAPIPFYNEDGGRLSPAELAATYGTTALSVEQHLDIPRTVFEPSTRTLQIAAARIRPELTPQFDPYVDYWLKIVGGTKFDHYPHLCDWLSRLPDLSRPLAALYMCGPKHTGKSLFAVCLARLWGTDGPSVASKIFGGNFNEDLLRNPLVWADEMPPVDERGRPLTRLLRAFLGTRTHSLNVKHVSSTGLRGCPRVVMSVQNDDMLATKEDLTQDDIDATAERIYGLRTDALAADWLRTLPEHELDRWDLGDAVARHVLWLRDHHTLHANHGRFVVRSPDQFLTRKLTVRTGWRSTICSVLHTWVMSPNPLITTHLKIDQGRLLVHLHGLETLWRQFAPSHDPPDTTTLSKLLNQIAPTTTTRVDRPNGADRPYRVVDLSILEQWIEDTAISTIEAFRAAIQEHST